MILRPYQTAAVDAVFDYFNAGHAGHPLIVMPTGTGKSLVIAALIQRILADYPTTRVLMLTHVKELISQNLDKLLRVWPDAPVGVYSAGLKQSNTDAPILFCGIQSVHNKAKALASETRPVELVFIDEAHRVPLAQEGTYRKFIADLTALNPYLRLIGLTATPYRHVPATKTTTAGYQSLIKGSDRLFTDVAYDLTADLVRLIQDDYLAALWPQPMQYQVNLKGLKIQNGDYQADQLNELMSRDDVINAILDEAIPMAQADGRRHWLVFCAGVESARFTAENLQARGIRAAVVAGDTPDRERAHTVREFRAGRLTALVSVSVLTTGFDAPVTDCIIMARPTISPVLYCLDSETEILTSHGWRKMGQIQIGDCVPSMDMETKKGKWAFVQNVLERNIESDEKWISYDAPRASFRVTNRHELIVATKKLDRTYTEFRKMSAEDVAKRGGLVIMPTAINMDMPGVPLSKWELYFVGIVLTDGSFTNQTVQITQSERHPEIIERIDECLQKCGLAYVKRPIKHATPAKINGIKVSEVNQRWLWTISMSITPRFKNKDTGIAGYSYKEGSVIHNGRGASYLLPYLDKDIAAPLMQCTKEQFDALFQGIWDGDGFKVSKCPSTDWTPQSMVICSARQQAVDKLQALACLHGYTAHLRKEEKGRSSPIWLLTITPQSWRSIQIGGNLKRPKVSVSEVTEIEKVWCIETTTGTIITRRKGKVTVMGNCQMVGRGMRPTEAKCSQDTDRKRGCLVLDFVGNVQRHGPIDRLILKEPSPKKPKPKKTCPECQAEISVFANPCPECGYVFEPGEKPPAEPPKANQNAIIAGIQPPPPPVRYEVSRVAYSKHVGKSGIPTLRVDYFAGFLRVASEWVCLEHTGYAQNKAVKWWRDREPRPMKICPTEIQQALDWIDGGFELKQPIAIHVRPARDAKSYPEIVRYEWPSTEPVFESCKTPFYSMS